MSLVLPLRPARADSTTPNATVLPADQVTVQTKVQEIPQYDSNPTLSLGRVIPLSGSVTQPEVTLNADTPTFHFSSDTQGFINRFTQAPLNSDDVQEAGAASYKTQLWQFAVNGGAAYDTTRTSEETASGVGLAGLRHLGWNVAPQAGVYLTPTDLVSLNGSLQESFYASNTLYTNYRVYGATPSWQHSFDALNSGYIILEASRYETTSQGPRLAINQFAPKLGWSTTIFPKWTVTLNAGLQKTYWEYPIVEPGDKTATSGLSYSVDIQYQGQQDSLHLTSAQQPNPTGLGTEANTLSVNFSEAHLITSRIEIDANILYQQSDYGNRVNFLQKYFVTATPTLTYHATSHLDLSVAYRYRQQGFTDTGAIAQGSGLLLYITLTPDTLGFR
jgi:hypothetical protein